MTSGVYVVCLYCCNVQSLAPQVDSIFVSIGSGLARICGQIAKSPNLFMNTCEAKHTKSNSLQQLGQCCLMSTAIGMAAARNADMNCNTTTATYATSWLPASSQNQGKLP